MSPQTAAQIRLNKIIACFTGAVNTLEVLAQAFQTPFLETISKTAASLVSAVQTVKHNKRDCAQLLEQTAGLLYAVVSVHVDSTTGPDLPPSMLNHLGKFSETLHKIHAYVDAQQNKTNIRQFFRQGESATLFKACDAGLQEALQVFKLQNVHFLTDLTDIQRDTEVKHNEVLQLIEACSDSSVSERAPSRMFSNLNIQNSSTSISMLPSEPKIFHGRETELSDILKLFIQNTPRIAILGPGGIGKTSLARAILHAPQITDKFEHHRFFVACESVSTKAGLISLIGTHLELKAGKDLTLPVTQFFASLPACLLILDNLETPWEPTESRGDIEEFLSVLTNIPQLALIITMRGAERPAKVQWTRPFLPTLQPLSQNAARHTFIDIADEGHDPKEMDQVLLLTDNVPLAIDLIAHLVDSEDCSSVLSRWDREKTSIISDGVDKRSNLDRSISLSLNSPRIRESPQAQHLLSLLSILPDGISDTDLLQSKLPLENILSCKARLLATSLAYVDEKRQLKALVPIREYMQKFLPPQPQIVQPLIEHFEELLHFWNKFRGTTWCTGTHARISSNFANIQNILTRSLHPDNPQLANSIYCTCYLQAFALDIGQGHLILRDQIPNLLSRVHDHKLEFYFISELVNSWQWHPVPDLELLIEEALEHLSHFDDSDLECRFYNILGDYLQYHNNDLPRAMHYYQTGLSLSISNGNTMRQASILPMVAWAKWQLGDYPAGRLYAHEAQRLSQLSGDLWGEAKALNIEAVCWILLGNYRQAQLLCSRGRYLLGLGGMSDTDTDHMLMATQADIHILKSEFTEALTISHRRLRTEDPEHSPYLYAMNLLAIGQIGVPMGVQREVVQRDLDTAKTLLTSVGYSDGVVFCDMVTADLNLREGHLQEACILFAKCLTFSRGKNSEMETYCLERLADGSRWCIADRGDWMSSWTTVYLAYSVKAKQKFDIHKSLQFLGDLFLSEDDQNTAMNLFTVALEGFTKMDVHRSRAACMQRLGDINMLCGDHSKAVELWTTAKPLFERSSQNQQVAFLNEKLAESSGNRTSVKGRLASDVSRSQGYILV